MVVVALVQVPPPTVLVNVVCVPAHADAVPVMAAGAVFIVIALVAKQPVDNVYTILVVPELPPVIVTGELALIDATVGSWVVHVPPAVASEKVVVAFWQIDCVPAIAAGLALTVKVAVERQEPIV